MKVFLKKMAFPIVGAIIGILAINVFNPFSYFPFLAEDQAYDVCIGLYFSLADISIEFVVNCIKNRFFNASIDVIISPPGVSLSAAMPASIYFRQSETTEAEVKIALHGKKEQFCETEVIIPAIGFATIQPSFNQTGGELDDHGNYVITLSSLLGQSEIVDFTKSFRLVMIREPVENIQSESIYPRAERIKRTVKFRYNYANIRTE